MGLLKKHIYRYVSLPVLTSSPSVSGSLPDLTGSSLFITGSHPEGPISQHFLRIISDESNVEAICVGIVDFF